VVSVLFFSLFAIPADTVLTLYIFKIFTEPKSQAVQFPNSAGLLPEQYGFLG
jgi:hypothetical protein